MPNIQFPTLEETTRRMQNDVQQELPNSNPYLPESFLLAVILGLAARIFENYNQLQSVLNALFLTTTIDAFLSEWGSIFGLTQKSASTAMGNVTVTGTADTVIASGLILTDSDGDEYSVTTTTDIQPYNILVTLTFSGTNITATTDVDHLFATGNTVTISGAADAIYNGSFEVVVITSKVFSYTVATAPTSADSGTASAVLASVPVESVGFGQSQNVLAGTTLTFQTIVSGVDDNKGTVQSDGITGGTDAETNDEYRARLLFRFRNPVAQFSVSAIENQAFLVPGVTRVFVLPITPEVGDVTVYFLRDNDAIIIPSETEVQQVRDSILLIYPASSDSEESLIVEAPIALLIDFDFETLSPDTATMREAIEANLEQFFRDNIGVGDDVSQQGYSSAIFNTIDPETGEQVTQFSLNAPVGTVITESNEIGLLGNVTYD